MKDQSKIIVQENLSSYFYDRLLKINKTLVSPLMEETLFYSSRVLERFSLSDRYFEVTEQGKVKEKILGLKYLQSSHLEREERRRQIQDIAETTLVLCGCFLSSKKKSIVSDDYYLNMGVMAYDQLNLYEPNYMDVPEFFKVISKSFENLKTIINILSDDFYDSDKIFDKYGIFSSEELKKAQGQ